VSPVPSVAQDLLDASLRSKLGLTNYEAWVVGKVIGLLNSADADLERRISIALEKNALADTSVRLQEIRKELLSANKVAYQRMGYFLSNEMKSLVVEQSEALADTLEGILPFKFSASRPSAELLHSLVTQDPLHGRLLGALSADGENTIIDNLAGNRAAALMEQIQQGVAQSESWGSILKRIRGTAAGNYEDGVLATIGRRQAETVARTAVQHFTEAARDTLIQANADLFQGTMWVSTLDRRTTKICQVRDGLVWDLDNRPVNHSLDWLGGPGRAHWNCRSTGIPVLKETTTLQRAGIVPENISPGERAALDNPVPVTTDYEEWLRTQDADLQAQALDSVARAQEFRDGASLESVWNMRFDRMRPVAPDRSG
jgi:hypothetical protein